MQVSKITYLFVADFGGKYATYSVNWRLKKPVLRWGNSLSRCHFIPEATSPVRVVIKNKNKSRPLQLIVNSKPLLFSR
jgi:hypothetical protein